MKTLEEIKKEYPKLRANGFKYSDFDEEIYQITQKSLRLFVNGLVIISEKEKQ